MDLNGNLGKTGIPKKIALPLGGVALAGAYVFYKRYKAAKTASQNTANNPATSADSIPTAYGPTMGTGPLNVTLPANGAVGGSGESAGLKRVEAQNTYIIQALQNIHEVNSRTAVGVAALANVNPGALQVIQQTGQPWETAAENQTVPWPVPANSPGSSNTSLLTGPTISGG